MAGLAKTPPPPYYVMIFTSRPSGEDPEAYEKMAERMVELVRRQPGFLGLDWTRGPDGLGFTVAYWDSLEAIRNWKENAEHLVAQKKGREVWYQAYEIRIARVERAYGFDRDAARSGL